MNALEILLEQSTERAEQAAMGDEGETDLGSGFRQVVHRCSRPVLSVSEMVTGMDRPLLAYDGSPKAREALYIAAYLAGSWHAPLTVVSVVEEGSAGEEALQEASAYLDEQEVDAAYFVKQPPAAAAILAAADQYDCDFLLVGGYGTNPLVEVVLGSVLDDLLRTTHKPVLICR